MHATTRRAPRGFTLVELLVVITIVGLISAVALPVVLPALNERKINEAARLLQAVLAGARDAAVRAGAPRGVRFLVDPIFTGADGQPLASNRMIAIEPGPDHSEGLVRTPLADKRLNPLNPTSVFVYPYPSPNDGIQDPAYYVEDPPLYPTTATVITETTTNGGYLRVSSSPLSGTIPNAPTGWSYNIRQGDKIRFSGSGSYYTIAGPVAPPQPFTVPKGYYSYVNNQNKERFIICTLGSIIAASGSLDSWRAEYLNLTNGLDDNGNGWIDESCDGIDNDGDGVIDPGFNGRDDDNDTYVDEPDELKFNSGGEYEEEKFVGPQASLGLENATYVISRQAVISPGARETSLPDGVVLDLTTWNAALSTPGDYGPNTIVRPLMPERSRLPVNPYTMAVDIMIAPNGQVVLPGTEGGGTLARTPVANTPFYHFWLTEREGVHAPLWDDPASPGTSPATNPNQTLTSNLQFSYLLPMPKGTLARRPSATDPNPPLYDTTMPDGNASGQNYSSKPVFLTGGRRLVTLFTRTGQIMTNSIESFIANDINEPYYAAQTGIKETQ